MKRTIRIAIVFAILSAATVTAQPFDSTDAAGSAFGGFRQGRGMSYNMPGRHRLFNDDETETVELAGRLQLTEREAPRLVVSGTEYVLRFHPWMINEIDVSNGEMIEVEGDLVEFRNPDLVTTDRVVFVRVLEADDTKIIMPQGPGSVEPGGWNGSRGATPGFGRSDRREDIAPRRGW